MKAVILAAGKGSRLMPLTANVPKTLVEYLPQKTILGSIIDAIPESINEIIIVVHTYPEKIKEFIAEKYPNKNISFVFQETLNGTYSALVSAKEQLKDGTFLVLSGDDLVSADELEQFITSGASVAIQKRNMPARYRTVDINSVGQIIGLRNQTVGEINTTALIITGTYILDGSFFKLPIQKNFQGEQGIPHTLLQEGKSYSYFEMKDWYPINTPDDLEQVNIFLKK